MESTLLLKANSDAEFKKKIQETKINVPKRGGKRKSEHTESWIMIEFLRLCYDNGLMELKFPIEVYHRDRPDFLIIMNGKKIGAEVTECINQKYAHFLAKQQGIATVIPSDLEDVELDEEYLKCCKLDSPAHLDTPGWDDNTIRKRWLQEMDHCIKYKLSKFKNKEFCKFDINHIVIYDNTEIRVFIGDIIHSLVNELKEKILKIEKDGGINSIFILTVNNALVKIDTS